VPLTGDRIINNVDKQKKTARTLSILRYNHVRIVIGVTEKRGMRREVIQESFERLKHFFYHHEDTVVPPGAEILRMHSTVAATTVVPTLLYSQDSEVMEQTLFASS
jgi:hypothetical protein